MKAVKQLEGNNHSIEHIYMVYGTAATFFLLFCLSMYHFYIGDFTVGAVNLLISLILLFVGIKFDQPKQIKHLNIILVVLFLVCLSFAILLKGSDALYWAFPAISATYFMASNRSAFVLTILCISLTYLLAYPYITTSHIIDYYPALFLHSFFQFCWASRTTRQQKKLYEIATRDALTKVNNRLSFNEKLDGVIKRNRRNRVPVSLLMLDLDHFKRINDKFGHDIGDSVLIVFAELITSSIRESDAIYRYGGDEFIVIADDTTIENASILAEQLRTKANKDLCLNKYQLSVSIGVTTLLPDFDEVTSVLKRVDNALYEAKKMGRNCVFQK